MVQNLEALLSDIAVSIVLLVYQSRCFAGALIRVAYVVGTLVFRLALTHSDRCHQAHFQDPLDTPCM